MPMADRWLRARFIGMELTSTEEIFSFRLAMATLMRHLYRLIWMMMVYTIVCAGQLGILHPRNIRQRGNGGLPRLDR